METWLTLGAGLVSVVALMVARRAKDQADAAANMFPEARKLITEIEDVLEKFAAQQSRQSMRHLRDARRRAETDPETAPEPTAAAAPGNKADLYLIAAQRGLGRGGR